MTTFRTSGFSAMPPVVKNLIIINVLMLLARFTAEQVFQIPLNFKLGLYYPASEAFEPYQVVTHMFMHGGIAHLFFNMFALWMFGRVLENVWGGKRFFIYFFITGFGAAALHMFVNYLHLQSVLSGLSDEAATQALNQVAARGHELTMQGKNWTDPVLGKLNGIMNVPTVGASGAVFGILLAFGMLFPNTQLLLIFPPIPIKAKYFVIFYGVLELYLGVTQPGSNVAHFAHLGGMLFGFILLKIWNMNKRTFY